MERPLAGIRVIGLEQYMAGPYCTMLLADAGAQVIKIERPGSGDPRRAMPPFVEKAGVRKAAGFMAYNRNKQSLALDFRFARTPPHLSSAAQLPAARPPQARTAYARDSAGAPGLHALRDRAPPRRGGRRCRLGESPRLLLAPSELAP